MRRTPDLGILSVVCGVRTVLSIVVLATGACGRIGYDVLPITSTEDAGHDAAAPADAGGRDAGAPDSGGPADAGSPEPDAALDASLPPCDEDPCKLVLPQCGCPVDEACQRTVRGEAIRECVPPGDVAAGEPCTQSIQCVTGHTCVGVDPPDGICSRYCTTSAECGAPAECTIFTAPSEGVGACTMVCDPVADTACPAGYGCHLLMSQRVEDDAAVNVTVCGPSTGGGAGAACTVLCAPGFMCLADSLCHELCVAGDASTCSVGGTCAAFGTPVRIGAVEYGICQ